MKLRAASYLRVSSDAQTGRQRTHRAGPVGSRIVNRGKIRAIF